MSVISCKNISVSYDGASVLKDLSFSVNSGDYLCIIGENGSGKSTLVKSILGLIKPQKGSIEFGEGLNKNDIGYLPQGAGVQKDFPASVWEVVLSGTLNKRGLRPFYSFKDKDLAHRCMKMLGVCDLSNKCYNSLSGGQQQRVLLARALCASGKVLLLDEPTTGLDPNVSGDFYRLIKELNQEKNITVIMITHDIKASLKDSTHVLELSKANYYFGTSEDYLKKENRI